MTSRQRRFGAVVAATGAIITASAAAAGGAYAVAAAPMATPGPVPAGATEIDLLNVNDFHGRIDEDGKGTTGLKFACTIEQAKAKYGETRTAFLSAGDNVGASPFTSSSQQDNPTLDYLNALELKVSAVGNHEFDKGIADLRDRIKTRAKFPYLSANVYAKGTKTPYFPDSEYKVIDVNGVKVGIVGAVTQQTPSMVDPAVDAAVDFGNPVEAVNRVTKQLKDGDATNGEADIVIAEYHEGATDGTPDGATLQQEVAGGGAFADIVNNTSPDVAAIFTAHTHKEYAWDAPIPGGTGTRPILQGASYGTRLGHIQLGIDPTTKKVLSYQAENLDATKTDPATCAGDPQFEAAKTIVTDAVAQAKAVGSQAVAKITADITTAYSGGTWGSTYTGGKRDDRLSESTLGNLEADAWKGELNEAGRPGADIGIMNPGGVRADLMYNDGTDNTGTITKAEAAAVNPFANTLVMKKVTGAQFKTLLEQQWQPAGSSRPFLKLGVSKNVSYTYDETAPAGSRITSIMVNGQPIDPNGTYRVGSGSFLMNGGDNFKVLGTIPNGVDTGLIDTDAFAHYLQKNSPVAPDFARRSMEVNPLPKEVVAGAPTTFMTKGWDLTSLNSPKNKNVDVYLDGKAIGTAPVDSADTFGDTTGTAPFPRTHGNARIGFTVPALTSGGTKMLKLVSQETGTTVQFPVEVKSGLVPVTPARIADSRTGQGIPQATIPADSEVRVKVAGMGGVPAQGASGAVLNVTAINPSAAGWLSVRPGDAANASSSNVNFLAGRTTPNAVMTRIGTDGTVVIRNSGGAKVDVAVDVSGYIAGASTTQPGDVVTKTPGRLADTRFGLGAPGVQVPAHGSITVQVTGNDDVPATAGAAAVNLTAVNPGATGYLTAHAAGTTRPGVSSLNFVKGATRANFGVIPVDDQGRMTVYNGSDAPVDVLVDDFGYVVKGQATSDGQATMVAPKRIADSRNGIGGIWGPIVGDSSTKVQVNGIGGIPVRGTAGAAFLNVTAINPQTGWLGVAPSSVTKPENSTLNTYPGENVAGFALGVMGQDGKVTVYNSAGNDTDLAVDVFGWVRGY